MINPSVYKKKAKKAPAPTRAPLATLTTTAPEEDPLPLAVAEVPAVPPAPPAPPVAPVSEAPSPLSVTAEAVADDDLLLRITVVLLPTETVTDWLLACG